MQQANNSPSEAGNPRKRLMKSAKRKNPGDQREPYKAWPPELLNQEAGFALQLYLAQNAKAPTPLLS